MRAVVQPRGAQTTRTGGPIPSMMLDFSGCWRAPACPCPRVCARRRITVSGHSKWAQIKRAKGANDVKRGQLFTKFGREITVSAREGGADPVGNARLRMAIDRAREANMPMDTIQRAVQRGVGSGEG